MIKETIEQYLPSDNFTKGNIVSSPIYKKVMTRLESIERFVSLSGFPQIIKATNEIILSYISNIRNPKIIPYLDSRIERSFNIPIILISTDGTFIGKDDECKSKEHFMLGISNYEWFTIRPEEATKMRKYGPIVNVTPAKADSLDDTISQTMIFHGYHLHPSTARPLIKDFSAVQNRYREDIILTYAGYKDKVENTDQNTKAVLDMIAQGKMPYMGISERSVKIFKKEIFDDKILGYSNEYNNNTVDTSIHIRMERQKR